LAVRVTASEEALGWEPGRFMAAHSGNQRAAAESALEADPVAVAVMNLVNLLTDHTLRGTSEALLEKLSEVVSDDVRHSKVWPRAPNALSRRLNRLAPLLRRWASSTRSMRKGVRRRSRSSGRLTIPGEK
jgi:hypothetical protein